MAIFVPPSVDGVKAVGKGGVGRLQLVDLLLAVPDLKTTMTDLGGIEICAFKANNDESSPSYQFGGGWEK